MAFFKFYVPARDGRQRGPIADLSGLSATRGNPLDSPFVGLGLLASNNTAVNKVQTARK